jgi:type IV secretion system protein VirB9
VSDPVFLRFLSMVFLVTVPAAVWAQAKEPRPIQTDHRVRAVLYTVDKVYKFTGHYGYQSTIEFAGDEEIRIITMGDPTGWMMNPSGNRLFLKPVDQDATTNMTLITNKRTYLFELHAKEAADIDDESMIFIMRFNYADAEGTGVKHFQDSVQMPDIVNEPGKYNFSYSITGPETISPVRIFDDGEFTYFEFRDKNADIPAIFQVIDAKGNEALINFRTRGDYVVVERVASQFTLRFGADIVCVFNEKMPLRKG